MEKQKKGSIIGIVIALVCCCVFSMSSIAFAATDESTITDGGVGVSAVPPAPIQQDGGISVRGKNPPTTDNVQNVGKKDYYFSVDHVGAQVYTSKWLTGKNRFWVEVNHWNKIKGSNRVNNKLTITLYNSKKKSVKAKTLTMSKNTTNGCWFTGTSTNAKYYIKFSVPQNGNQYSFDGYVK